MGKIQSTGRYLLAAPGVAMLILSIADVPTKVAIWHGWFTRLAPHLHTLTFRWILGIAGIAICLAPRIAEWCKPKKENIAVADQTRPLNLELIPHGSNSPLLCLEVRNRGDGIHVTATVRVVSRSYGGPVNTRPYMGQWTLPDYKQSFRDTRKKPTASSVTIPSNAHAILEIARQSPENGRGNDISVADLVGFNEYLQWEFEQKADSSLPSLRLRDEFQAKGVPETICKIFDVGPVHAYGPLGMTEVTI